MSATNASASSLDAKRMEMSIIVRRHHTARGCPGERHISLRQARQGNKAVVAQQIVATKLSVPGPTEGVKSRIPFSRYPRGACRRQNNGCC